MIRLQNLTLQRGRKILFENVNITLHRGERIGVTGANGTGKTSLFGLMLSEMQPDVGELDLPSNLEIAHVRQETPAYDCSAIDYVLQGDVELTRLNAEIANASEEALGQLYAKYEAIDGYSAQSRAARLLHGLGFKAAQYTAEVQSFSGGWRMRLNLAQALMCRSDLLLLDEPTNHLDVEAVVWLEQWLRLYQGTLLLVSHDREFLDRVVNRIAHIEQQGITAYRGNYSDFEVQRAEKLAQQQAAFEKQQTELAHLQTFVDRFRAKATKAKQAQSRLKAMERMEKISAAHVDSEFRFQFLPCGRVGDPLLKLEKASLGYGDTPILENLALQLRPGSRVGLLGPNGAGKSTLVKTLAEELPLIKGERISGNNLKIGYFAQHQVDHLDLDASALEQFQKMAPTESEQTLRNHLGGFGFHGERVDEPIRPFSGGEKSRLALAYMIWHQPNLLLLDEPTNHLDLEMRDALSMALQGYEGALVVVSHDRHLLRTCCDELYVVLQGGCKPFDGDLDDYQRYIADQLAVDDDDSTQEAPKQDRKALRQAAAERRRQMQPLVNKRKKLERELEKAQQTQATLETALGDETIYTDESRKAELQKVIQDKAAADGQVDSLEEEWLLLSEEIEGYEEE